MERLVPFPQRIDDTLERGLLGYPAGCESPVPGIIVLDAAITQYALSLDPGQGRMAQLMFRGVAGDVFYQVTVFRELDNLHT